MFTLPSDVTFLERGWLSSNNIVLQDEAKAVLIDSGYWTHAEQTHALVAHHLGGRPLQTLINTHLHSDHCGGNALLQNAYPGLELLVPPGHAVYVENWDPKALSFTPTGQHCPQFRLTGVIQPGAKFIVNGAEWQCHAAPGHDPNALIIFNAQDGILISADALWENGFGAVFPEIEGFEAFDEVEATLQMIEELKPRCVLPGHGGIFEDVPAALARARSRLAQFRAAPDKHASHLAKVLLKFKLLELQRVSYTEFYAWSEDLSYLRLAHKEYAGAVTYKNWIRDLCLGLEKSGACAMDGDFICNAN
jgi:glyoxylase-like metal-dependent hydrolase (beta-lactamase superfamily II)